MSVFKTKFILQSEEVFDTNLESASDLYEAGIEKGVEKGYNSGYEAGYNKGYEAGNQGYEDGYNKGFVEGFNDYLTTLFNGLQNYGTQTDYQQFCRNWKDMHNYFYPLYDMNGGSMMFYGATSDMGLPELLERAGGRKIDWTWCSSFSQNFSYSRIPDVGKIDCTNAKCTCTGSLFLNAKIGKAHLILKADGSLTHSGTFTGATELTELTVEGAIGTSWTVPSPLTPESMINNIEHLVNYAGTDKEFTYKVQFTDDCWEALENHSSAPDGGKWKDYVEKLGWNT